MLSVKVLAQDQFKVVGIIQGADGRCPAEHFLTHVDANTRASRDGLLGLLDRVSKEGLDGLPPSLCHLVDKNGGIYEFVKGSLRLFFFKGSDGDISVCTGGLVKKTQKVDASAVSRAIAMKRLYEANKGQINYVED